MADKARKDSESLPVEETLDKPLPHPLQESGNQIDFTVNFLRCLARLQQQQPSKWEKLVQFMTNAIQTVTKFFAFLVTVATGIPQRVTKLFAFLVAVATGILQMESEIPKEKIRERNEMKEKGEEITVNKLKEIEHHKWNLEEKIKRASRREISFRISYVENKELEISLITAKNLVVTCEYDIAYLHDLADKLKSEAKAVIMEKEKNIKGIIIGGLVFALFAVLYCGATVKGVAVVSLLAVGIAMFCKREAQMMFNNSKLVAECEQVKHELEKTKLVYKKYKHAVKDTLPEQKKLLHVMDHEVSLYRSLQGIKYKDN